MQSLINNNVKNIQISGIRRFFQMVADEKDVVQLTIGQPDFQTPDYVKSAASNAIFQNKTTYTHNAGIIELRKAIATFNEKNYGISFDPASEIIVTSGASQAIDITFRTILSPGDEVILPGPIYPGYEPLITLSGAKTVYADTTNTNFKLTKKALAEHITPKTRCIVLPYPSNPTGASFTRAELLELIDVLKDKDIFILADEIYSELIFDREHISIASFPSVKNKTIVINGLSKSHSMTGFRVGYVLAPAWISEHILKVHQYNVSCASSISQYAALEALTHNTDSVQLMREAYKKRRDYVYERLHRMGLSVTNPDGAFYFFPKFPIKEMSSLELGLALVRKGKVALVPGDSFSSLGEGYMRLSYAYHPDTLTEGLNRIESFLQHEQLK
ncbi:aminotransferase A [Oceanobacillus sp. FSL K6-2867]|uniref:aminotransferase A n=1 Tax=Oceanobacillus sp. FSL K6-2867 TaxID=2954748 RepID=UPI0030DB8F89